MKTLVYKRTHTGDPSEEGEFGCNGCMGHIRSWPFDAVIGIGGVGAEPEKNDIAYKLTWIGIGPHKRFVDWMPDPILAFDHFRLFDQNGMDFRDEAPILAHRIYTKHIRATMTFTVHEAREVKKLLVRAKKWPPSPVLGVSRIEHPEPKRRCTLTKHS